jgi:drug/metabolite transporter (DMT)-like permease
MPLGLALASAAMWGTADFMGGIAARKISPFRVAFLGQLVGLVIVTGVLPFLPGEPSAPDLAWGAAAGIGGGLGILCLYKGLGEGRMNVVAPVTAVCAAALPVIAGLALGEVPGTVALIGVGLAILAVALLGMQEHPRDGGEGSPTGRVMTRRSLGLALGAGVGFAIFYIFLGQTSEDSGLWPLLSDRIVACVLLGAIPFTWRASPASWRTGSGLVLGAGALDMAANVSYLLAVQRGSLTLVAVLASLYPAGTVLLSRFLLEEPLGRLHAAGLVLALIAVALIAGGSA